MGKRRRTEHHLHEEGMAQIMCAAEKLIWLVNVVGDVLVDSGVGIVDV